MGNQKLKWTSEEEEALRAGVIKHGTGKWKNILKDPDFASSLTHRSNIDLKDKWRNMNMNVTVNGHGLKEKTRSLKVKAIALPPPPLPLLLPSPPGPSPNAQNTLAIVPRIQSEPPLDSIAIPVSRDTKSAPRYNTMIFESLAVMKEPGGSEVSAIAKFIEEKHDVPPNFRRMLSSRLRRLVSQGKLEKVTSSVHKGFRLKDCPPLVSRTPTQKQKGSRHRQVQKVAMDETVEEAARIAAYKLADAESKSFVAAEAIKEAERVASLAEDTDVLLQIVLEMYEKCLHGEIVTLPQSRIQ